MDLKIEHCGRTGSVLNSETNRNETEKFERLKLTIHIFKADNAKRIQQVIVPLSPHKVKKVISITSAWPNKTTMFTIFAWSTTFSHYATRREIALGFYWLTCLNSISTFYRSHAKFFLEHMFEAKPNGKAFRLNKKIN